MSHPSDNLPAAVRRHAAVHPHAPWLFERPDLDWLWISWQQAADRLALPPGAAPERPGPAALLHYLQLAEVPGDGLAGAAALAGRLGPPEIRDILVSGRPLSDPAEHRLLAWATLSGAVILFEPDPAAYVPAAAWARPTVFQGTAAEIAALRREATSFRPAWPGRRPRLPFGRLRAILPLEPLPAEDEAFWTGRGAAIVSPC